MTDFLWPLAFIAVSTIFFLIFRVPMSTLIKRTKSIGRDGFDATDEGGVCASFHNHPTELVATLREEHLAEIKRIEESHAERYAKTVEPLQRMANQQAKQIAEIISRVDTIESNRVISKMLAAPPLKPKPE
jgi:hypothetical protein